MTTLLWLGFSGVFLYNFCFLKGLKYISAGRGALVIALDPVVIALVSWLWLKDKMTPLKALGIATALAGCVLVISDGHPERLLKGDVGMGELLILGCVVYIHRATRNTDALAVGGDVLCLCRWLCITGLGGIV
ncbi:hypothetical protein GCM10009007_15450 [Formosimonas limnophila]|uniref:EamA domain-containing protein n=2 Tax=Formosimonas limnophila TaxID=1384487 RepID=A0A8J3CNC7_9BURK|nr:hypothetical protein GCM10009007_15450 [Formosimonas limnophila]